MGLIGKLLKKEDDKKTIKRSINEEEGKVYAPVNGKVVTLESLGDGMFSEKIMGDGVVITPSDGKFFSPVSGTVESVFPTGHAYGIRTNTGIEVLIHIGLDTVSLNGKGFHPHVTQGQKVSAGDRLATIDLEIIKNAGYQVETIIIVTSENEITGRISADTAVKAGERLLDLK